MIKVDDWNSLGVKPFYLERFQDIPKVGYLLASDDLRYYAVESDIGNIGITSVTNLNTHPRGEHIGGDFRADKLFYKSGLYEHWKPIFDQYYMLIMITGCDDHSLAFYATEESIRLLDEIETLDELLALSVSTYHIDLKFRRKEEVDFSSILFIGDVRN